MSPLSHEPRHDGFDALEAILPLETAGATGSRSEHGSTRAESDVLTRFSPESLARRGEILSPEVLEHTGPVDALSRRRMLQVMGASMALATAAGCRFESEDIVPLQVRPADRKPGTTRRFATALETSGVAASLLVTSYDGRPIKIEGNPDHPLDAGAATARSQAAVLDLYDPDHSSGLVQQHEGVAWPRTWKEFDPWFAGVVAGLVQARGAGVAFLLEPTSSLTFAHLRTRVAALLPEAAWVEYEPVSRAEERAGAELAFGRALRTRYELARAKTLVCFDADLLGTHPAALAHARAWAARRDPAAKAGLRTWVFESTPSTTGAVADHRVALRAEQVAPFLMALEHALAARGALTNGALTNGALTDGARPVSPEPKGGFLARPDVARALGALADELKERRGASVLAVGAGQPAVVHALAHRLNVLLGNVGTTVELFDDPDAGAPAPARALSELVSRMEQGAVSTLFVLGGNPVHDAPADVDFRRALRRVTTSYHLSTHRDETSRACTWHLPRAHALESWGDARSWDGTVCVIQPLIDRIFERRTSLEFLAAIAGEKAPARDLVRKIVAPRATDGEWQRVVHDGFVRDSRPAALVAKGTTGDGLALAKFDVPAADARAFENELANGSFELVLAPDARLYDGRSGNNAWLHELPDPITKVAWGNPARVGSKTAAALGVVDGSIVRLKVGARAVETPIVVVPGTAEGSVTLPLGHGRTAAGRVGGLAEEGIATVGCDAYALRTASAPNGSRELSIEVLGRTATLARTQDGAHIDAIGTHGREERIEELAREMPLAALIGGGDPAHGSNHGAAHGGTHEGPHESLWSRPVDESQRRFGMAIDLSACIGCNACAIACQAENNVPVVGAEQVARGRIMHWIRIDRYFRGGDEAPKLRFQPITCQHCESAPCEQVCPVAATVHSAEGLNDMVYNRCVGTRYCANNCPFKVRRFNYFNYHKELERDGHEVQRMLYNPEVTLRARGVMEKCTFCVQRIQAAKIQAKNAGRPLADGEIVTACQQTCPTQAIVFGDLADPESRVARLHAEGRAYGMLGELNLRPRTAYLARVTDENPGASHHGV